MKSSDGGEFVCRVWTCNEQVYLNVRVVVKRLKNKFRSKLELELPDKEEQENGMRRREETKDEESFDSRTEFWSRLFQWYVKRISFTNLYTSRTHDSKKEEVKRASSLLWIFPNRKREGGRGGGKTTVKNSISKVCTLNSAENACVNDLIPLGHIQFIFIQHKARLNRLLASSFWSTP